MRLLIENGANINAVNSQNNTALIIAISKGNSLKHVENFLGFTLENTMLSFSEFFDIAELLIQKGIDVNTVIQDGFTCLIVAARRGK